MKGAIFKATSKAGRTTWRYQIDAGRDENGNRIRPSESGFKLEREASDAMNAAIRDLKGGYVRTAGTLGDFLRRWLPYHATAKKLSPKSVERNPSLAAHVISALGHVALKDLTPFLFDDLYVKLLTMPQPKTGRALSAKTIRNIHGLVHTALRRAVKTKLIPFNPTAGCDLPRVDQREMRVLNSQQLTKYQQTATGSWVDLLIRVTAATGVRRGEALACRWSDFSFDTLELRIERSLYQVKLKGQKSEIGIKTTKTRQTRVVVIPESLVEYLKFQKQAQEQRAALVGVAYRRDLDLIFAGTAGEFLLPSSVTRASKRMVKKAGFAGMQPLHGLRHTHASMLIKGGAPVPEVSKRLGHRDPHTTAKLYAHALPDTGQNTAKLWDKMMAEESAEPKLVAQLGTIPEVEKSLKN